MSGAEIIASLEASTEPCCCEVRVGTTQHNFVSSAHAQCHETAERHSLRFRLLKTEIQGKYECVHAQHWLLNRLLL